MMQASISIKKMLTRRIRAISELNFLSKCTENAEYPVEGMFNQNILTGTRIEQLVIHVFQDWTQLRYFILLVDCVRLSRPQHDEVRLL